ncbi:MAG: hypothetical protein ACYDHU_03580 [Acidimicrobiales bacterium]
MHYRIREGMLRRGAAAAALLCLVTATAALTVAGLGPAGVAGAGTGTAFTLKAASTGIELAAGGTTLVGAAASAAAGSSTAPVARGTGVLTPVEVSNQQATVSAPGQSQELPRSCNQLSNPFPAPFSTVVSLGSGCSSASASEDSAGLPSSTATGQVTTIGVNPSAGALPLPIDPGSTLASGLQGVLGTLPTLPTGGTPLATVLQEVAKAANTQLTSLVTANLGSSTSTVTVTGSTATATTQDSGSQITVLVGLGAGGGPLLTVTAGPASTTTTLDRSTGQVTASESAATLSVTVNPPVGSAQTVSIAPGQSQTFLAGTPLETTVAAGSGSATPGSGKGSASATGISIDALPSVGAGATGTDGGLKIVLGAATTSATGAVPATTAAVTPTTAPPAAPATTTPATATVPGATTVHTGEFWSGTLPLVLFGLSLLVGLGLVARRSLWRLLHSMTSFVRFAPPSASGRPPGRATGTSSVSPLVSGPARRLFSHRPPAGADGEGGSGGWGGTGSSGKGEA